MNAIASYFLENFEIGKILADEPMKNHTTFKIGGNADVLFLPENEEDIIKAIKLLKEKNVNYFIMGNGSNLLVSDSGYRGAVIKLGKNMSHINVEEGGIVRAQAGATLAAVAAAALKAELSGMEFASGIPGTVGGGTAMNAGAYGGEMKDIIKEVKVMYPDGKIDILSNEAMGFSYRSSKATKENLTVIETVFSLNKGDRNKIKELMDDLNQRRREKQPLNYPSAGSTFKRPEGHFAGKLIMDSGLRGFKIGGAMVSELHCGFVINAGNATCEDVLNLMAHIKKVVYENYDVILEPEVKII